MTRKPRLLVLNQYYWPGLEATGHLLSELLAALSPEFDIAIITGRIAVHAPHAERLEHDGVRIIRVRSTAYDRTRLVARSINYLTYLAESLRVATEMIMDRITELVAGIRGEEPPAVRFDPAVARAENGNGTKTENGDGTENGNGTENGEVPAVPAATTSPDAAVSESAVSSEPAVSGAATPGPTPSVSAVSEAAVSEAAVPETAVSDGESAPAPEARA